MNKHKITIIPSAFVQKHNTFFFSFFYLLVYHIFIVNRFAPWKLDDFTYSLLCVDFSFGFASKLLPGAVFRAIFGSNANMANATVYTVTLLVLIFAGVSAFADKFMTRVPERYKSAAAVLLVLFFSGAYTFAIFTKWPGLLDTYWLVFLLLFFAFLENKALRFLIPFIFLGSLMIHFSALVFFIPVFAIVLLYRISVSKSKSEKIIYSAIFTVSIIATAILFWFLILNESKMICPIDEFHKKLENNGTTFFRYFDYSFFNNLNGNNVVAEEAYKTTTGLERFIYLFFYQAKTTYSLLDGNIYHGVITIVMGLVMLVPILCLFIKLHFSALRKKGNFIRRLSAFLMIVQIPFMLLMAFLFAVSVDMTRYYTHLFLGAFACCLTVLYYEDDLKKEFFEQFQAFCGSVGVRIYILAYIMFTLMAA